MKDKLEKRISKIEKRMLANMKSNKGILVSIFYTLSLLCIVYPICYYTLFVHDFFNPQSTITFSYMIMGMVLGFGSCMFCLIGCALKDHKVKL